MNRPKDFGGARRIVVKIGSSVLRNGSDFDRVVFASLVRELAELKDKGLEPVIVCSGAVALGFPKLGHESRPQKLEQLQACAAVGQARLMHNWNSELNHYGYVAGQVLLTHDDLKNRRRFLAARDTLRTLINHGALPVVNENDTVAIDEIKMGDNDLLSSQVVSLTQSSFLVILSDTDGLYDGLPTLGTSRRISNVAGIDDQILALAGDSQSGLGSGGMKTKIEAVRQVNELGVPAIIAKGKEPGVLTQLAVGADVGAWFQADTSKLKNRKHWIAYALKSKGVIRVDSGAIEAVRDKGKSLLPIGVLSVDGDFEVGDAVQIATVDGHSIGQGLASLNADKIRQIAGRRSDDLAHIVERTYVIHCDDLVIYPNSSGDAGVDPVGLEIGFWYIEDANVACFSISCCRRQLHGAYEDRCLVHHH